jgi:hypothetical protein
MNRTAMRLLIASLTFAIGLIATSLWPSNLRPASPPVTVATQVENLGTAPAPKQVTFERLGFTDMFRDFYKSSEGVTVSYANDDLGSSSRANKEMLRELEYAIQVVDRTPKLNADGRRIGERVVVLFPLKPGEKMAFVLWTEGSHLLSIHAPTIEHALEFERWRASTGIR